MTAPPAHAGLYTVWSCRVPGGGAASTSDWQLDRRNAGTASLTNACPGGPLKLQLAPNASHASNDEASLLFYAPADTEIRGYRIFRSVRLSDRYNYWHWDLGLGTTQMCHTTFNGCSSLGDLSNPFASENQVLQDDRSGMSGIQFKLTCGEDDAGTTACPASDPAAVLRIYRAQLTLADTTVPVLEAAPSGPLVDAHAPLTGTQPVWISASDRGGGVYRAMLEVDGTVAAAGVLDDNGGRCQEPFTVAKPCPSQAGASLALDTTQLTDGPHLLRVLVTDTTGTNTAEWGPVQIVTANAGCNPTPRIDALQLSAGFATRGGHAVRRSVRARYGTPLALEGRLAGANGDPLPGARVCVLGREDSTGAPLTTYGSATTNASGRFAFTVPGGPSRTIYVVHRVSEGAVVTQLRTRVQAALSLRPSDSHLRNGQRVLLRGRLAHGPVPRRGALVELQAQRGTRWQTFGTTRTRRGGRYRFAYRFTRTTGVQRYAMRAFVAEQDAYPYAAGASRPIRLVVSGP